MKHDNRHVPNPFATPPAAVAGLLSALTKVLAPDELLGDAASRLVYAQDASHLELGRPAAVALPRTAGQVADVVRLCAEAGVPIVCRGSGTGLSGGAVPGENQLVLSLARLQAAGDIAEHGFRIRAEAGILNEHVTRLAQDRNLHFAPDPSSQSIATIGGNIAENAGGPHCLRYGVTLQHLLALQWVDAAGRSLDTGPPVQLRRGLDLVSLLCGSEGTLGVVTGADLVLTVTEPDTATMLAFFPDLPGAVESVVAVLGSGLMPVAMEIIDQPMLEAVETAFAFGFPTDQGAALIAEFTGEEQGVADAVAAARDILMDGGASEVRLATDAAERLELWKCRKKAFGAVGRMAPRYVTMDVVVPLGELPGLVADIHRIQQKHDVHIATAFHAGDGNLHPGVHYDDRIAGETERAHLAADEIIRAALDRDGSATGEHGVGIEKLHVLAWQLDRNCADLMRGVAKVFDPAGQLNPGKALPPRDADFAEIKPRPATIDFRWDGLTVSAPAEVSLAEIQRQALARGFWLPVGVFADAGQGDRGLGTAGNVGDLIDGLVAGPGLLAAGTARDYLLEYWGETGDGRPFHVGAPVFKNVLGYGLGQALCGADGRFARCRAATFQLKPAPEAIGIWRLAADDRTGPDADQKLRLWSRLQHLDSGWAPPVIIADSDTDRLVWTVIAAGADRTWGLDRLQTVFRQAEWSGCFRLTDGRRHAFGEASALLDGDVLPDWTRAQANWSAYTPLPAPGRELGWPSGEDRYLLQSRPQVLWTPAPGDPQRGWHLDRFWTEGGRGPLPAPTVGMPQDILRRLKSLMDPDNLLGGPSWLTGGDDS